MGNYVYIIGLHAVQFGNNWMRKIPRTAKLDEAVGTELKLKKVR